LNADCVISLISPSLTIAGWINKYGPLITIRSRFENIVIIGRYKAGPYMLSVISSLNALLQAAVDIMENQGKFTADRPRMNAAGEMFNGAISIAFVPFGDRFRRMRRLVI
jgi:hypothetical protein